MKVQHRSKVSNINAVCIFSTVILLSSAEALTDVAQNPVIKYKNMLSD